MIREFISLTTKHIYKDISSFDKRFIIILILVHLILNIPSLSNFYISIDDEVFAFDNPYKAWISIDRWTAALVNIFLFTHSTLPFLPFLFYSICISLSFIFLSISYKIHTNKFSILQFLIFSIHPIWYFITNFDGIVPSIGVGLIFSSISIYFFNLQIRLFDRELIKYRYLFTVLCIISLSFGIGAYQSFLFFSLISFIFVVLIRFLEDKNPKEFFNNLINAIILSSVGFVLHLVISQVFKTAFSITTSEYLLSFVKIRNINDIFRALQIIIDESIQFYSGSKLKYGIQLVSFPILIVIALLGLLENIKDFRVIYKLLIIICFCVIGLLPFTLNLLGDFMPSRSLFPIANSFLIFSILASKIKFNKIILTIVSVFFIFQSIMANSYYAAMSTIVGQHDILIASQLYNRIGLIDPEMDREKDITINIFGRANFTQLAYSVPWSANMGVSFFDWDNGSMYRIVAYMRLMGYRVVALPNNERQKYAHYFKDMPAWPSSGSIKKIDNVYLIKLSKEPDLFHSQLQ